jgi:hypothetical protein
MSEEKNHGLGEQARALRDDLRPSNLDEKLQEKVEERPKTRHLLDFAIVGKALLAAAIVALILGLIFSPRLAAVALVVVFFGTWLGLAQLSYDRRRQTSDPDAEDVEPDPSGYQGDRGEVEAEREQEGDAADDDGSGSEDEPAQSRNGSAPDRERTTN